MLNARTLTRLQNTVNTARTAYAEAQALSETVSNAVLTANEYFDEDGQRITSHRDDCMMNDTDFATYLVQCGEEYARRGVNHDPELVYEEPFRVALRNAEDALIDACATICPAIVKQALPEMRTHWKYRSELVNLNMRLAI